MFTAGSLGGGRWLTIKTGQPSKFISPGGEIVFKGKKILVTGGTGSFGRYIVEKLLSCNPEEIRIFSRDEKKQDDMRQEHNNKKGLRFIIGDVRDKSTVRKAMKNIDIVFHAAALKQVPSCEYNVFEAVRTNIIGAQNVIDCALEENVEKVIAISTDKAVEPINAMGMTKAVQEKLIISANLYKEGRRTIFACVRYGNVLGSRGSVVSLFKELIRQGKPLPLTHPDMTRFILTLRQSIQLVFWATEHAVGGEIFVYKSPAHKVLDLAEVMLEALNKSDCGIKEIGIRPGEKIHETLISPTESLRTIEKDEFFIILPQIPIESIEKRYPNYTNTSLFRYSSDNATRLDKKEILRYLKDEKWL